jgi:hypothetical protein
MEMTRSLDKRGARAVSGWVMGEWGEDASPGWTTGDCFEGWATGGCGGDAARRWATAASSEFVSMARTLGAGRPAFIGPRVELDPPPAGGGADAEAPPTSR